MKKQTLLRDLYVKRDNLVPLLAERIFSTIPSALAPIMLSSLKGDQSILVNAVVSPKDYSSANEFRLDYLMTEMFSKYPNWDLKIDRTKVALAKFEASEAQCAQTNVRLTSFKAWPYGTAAVFETARRKIERLLGPFNWNEACIGFDFGPGGTTRLQRKHADKYYKFSGKPECTSNALPLADAVLRYFTSWGLSVSEHASQRLTIGMGNKVITVPKNAKTDRVIAKEPDLNVFIQKGVGAAMRRRLKKVGVDLDSQLLNQTLALAGSIDGSLATLDLSAASDSISLELCQILLPPDWMTAISSCRSERGVLPSGDVVTYRKVSSMGNGFTFELESLIFWALCSSVRSLSTETDRRMAIYGDDIIVPTSLVGEVTRILEFAGFQLNSKKSHVDGPFRESCGKHYFLGTDVTPIYIKKNVDNYPRYIWLCNQLKRWSYNQVWGLDPLLYQVHEEIRGKLGRYWSKPRIPDGFGDGALIGNFDEVAPKKAIEGHCGWRTTFFAEKRIAFLPDDNPILLKSLFRLEKSPSSGGSYLRIRKPGTRVCIGFQEGDDKPEPPKFEIDHEDSLITLDVPTEKRRYVMAKGAVWQWADLGPWLV